jgi:hypothetical protein
VTEPRRLSLGRLAVAVMGAGVGVLALATAVLMLVKPAPLIGLLVVAAGVIGAIAAMGVTSKAMLRRTLPVEVDRTDPDGPDSDTD